MPPDTCNAECAFRGSAAGRTVRCGDCQCEHQIRFRRVEVRPDEGAETQQLARAA
jgi:hypothetical protein